MRGQNIKNIFVIDDIEYSKEQLSEEQLQLFNLADKNRFVSFRNFVISMVGDEGYATIKIFPGNQFRAILPDGQIFNSSEIPIS